MANSDKFEFLWRLSGHIHMALILLLVKTSLQGAEGCHYSKLDSSHTMCVFKAHMCSGKRLIKSNGLSCVDREIILKTHNGLRQNLALGRVTGQPAALNMETMVWNDELAIIAQRWADQCMPGHDRSRNTARYTVGQNVAAVWTYDRDEGPEPDFKTQIEAWFNEVMKQGFSKSTIDPFRYSKTAGHYTQLAWASTYMVGCGYSYYHDKSTGYTKLYVCNYAPGGNIVGDSMYEVGFPDQPHCVQHGLKPNVNMQGLCARDGVDYMPECTKTQSFSNTFPVNSHRGPSSSTIMMLSPSPRRPSLMMMLMTSLTASPHLENNTPKSHKRHFHSSTLSHSPSMATIRNTFPHGLVRHSNLNKVISPQPKSPTIPFTHWKTFKNIS